MKTNHGNFVTNNRFIINPHFSKLPPPKNQSIEDYNMVTLPREVLKWLQSLDLTYSIKNIKKDFINGFLVAQVLSRYYPHCIPMHTIDNGVSKKARKDNWQLIQKYLQNKDIKEEGLKKLNFEQYIENENNEVINFVILLYTQLTNNHIDLSENRNLLTDIDNKNKSFLLKDNGEYEPLSKDNKETEKKNEEPSMKTNSKKILIFRN